MSYRGFRQRAFCRVEIGSKDDMGNVLDTFQDITAVIDPYLISIQTCVREGDSEDVAVIELDDREGKLAIPPDQAPINIRLGWRNEGLRSVFMGSVAEVESGFSRRGGGRRLWIEAKCFDRTGEGLAGVRFAWGDGESEDVKLSSVLEEAAKAAGFKMKVSPSMAQIARKYWAQNESFVHFGQRLARELGGYFKIKGDTATFVNAIDGIGAAGAPAGAVEAVWGENLIGWRIKPFVARPQAGQSMSISFDKLTGAWGEIMQSIGAQLPFGRSMAIAGLPGPAPNKQVATQWDEGLANLSQANRGVGSVIINGEPSAQPQGTVKLEGARAGVDGEYSITEVEHVYSRSGGFITRLTANNPKPYSQAYRTFGWPEKTPQQERKAREEQERQLALAAAIPTASVEEAELLAKAAEIPTEELIDQELLQIAEANGASE